VQLRNKWARLHWHSASERYTTGDRLEAAVHNGWAICRIDAETCVLGGGGRQVIVYQLELVDHETAQMRLVSNPFIERYLAQASRLCFERNLSRDCWLKSPNRSAFPLAQKTPSLCGVRWCC
jgi:hypothetical protein